MNFGQSIEAMKANKCVARSGWNGKNMHIYLEDMWSFPIRDGIYKGQNRKYDPVICMFTAQGTHQPGWLASQADILAEDWEIVNPA
mgnify:FL=1